MTVIERWAVPVRRLEWKLAKVRKIVVETYRVKSLILHVTSWQGHLPGQHVDIRLTAEDGYQAQRSYSIASPPEDEWLTLTVEQVDNGEVSPYLVRDLGAMARGDPALRVVNTLTRKQPEGWMGHRQRIDKAMLAEVCFPPEQHPKIFVCGPTSFVETASSVLVELGHDPLTIKTERFGPSGGQAP